MGRIESVCDALGFAINAAINNAGITVPAQGYKGYPLITELKEIMDLGQYAWAVNPLPGGRRLPLRGKDRVTTVLIPPTLIATVVNGPSGTTVTFSGTPVAGYNINLILGHPILGKSYVYYQVLLADTLSSIATAVTTLVNGVGAPMTATVVGPVITIQHSSYTSCNVGTTGTISQAQTRLEQRIQFDVWVPTAYQKTGDPAADIPKSLRSAVVDAVLNNVATDVNQWYDLPDATSLRLRLSTTPLYRDDSQAEYNIYQASIIFLAEYTLDASTTATQVGVFKEITTVGGGTPVINIGG